MVSRFASVTTQGRVLGQHRSRGDIGTAIGPLAQAVVFSFFGATVAFGAYGLLVFLPILLIRKVVPPRRLETMDAEPNPQPEPQPEAVPAVDLPPA